MTAANDPQRAPQGFAADGNPPYGDDSGPARAEVRVSVMDTDAMRDVLAILSDAREAICSAMSEGWDMLDEETRDELGAVLERIDRIEADRG